MYCNEFKLDNVLCKKRVVNKSLKKQPSLSHKETPTIFIRRKYTQRPITLCSKSAIFKWKHIPHRWKESENRFPNAKICIPPYILPAKRILPSELKRTFPSHTYLPRRHGARGKIIHQANERANERTSFCVVWICVLWSKQKKKKEMKTEASSRLLV